MKKQGKRSKKKQLSKEVFRKITYKQVMCQIHKHTRNENDCKAYEQALNSATNEGRSQNKTIIKTVSVYVRM